MAKRYETVYNDIVEKINSGEYMPNDMLPTEKNMLTYYDVSRITIQKAMNILVQQGIVERIAGKGTFVRNKNIEKNEEAQSNTYAVIIPFQLPESIKLVMGMQDYMMKINNKLLIYFSDYNERNEIDLIKKLLSEDVSGIIIYTLYSDKNKDFYRNLVNNKVKIVFIDKEIYGLSTNLVISDNFNGDYCATKHLLNSGHSNIAFISYSFNWGSSLKERFNGFRQAMVEQGYSPENLIYDIDIKDEWVFNSHLSDLINNHPEITAILCSTDPLACKTYEWVENNGYKIPEDFSVIGFDDDSYAETMTPPLTTISQNYYLIGTESAKLIIDLCENPTDNLYKITVPVTLVERNSVKKMALVDVGNRQ